MKRLFLMMVLSLAFVGSSFGWELSGKALGIGKPGISVGEVPIGGEDVLAVMPLVDAQYSFATENLPNSYGIGVKEAFGIFNLKPGNGSNVNVNALLFIGGGLNTNLTDFFAKNGQGVVVVEWGVEIGIPAAQGIPQLTVGIQGEFDKPGTRVTVGGAVPLESIADSLIHIFAKL
jgi:hypothetical protein